MNPDRRRPLGIRPQAPDWARNGRHGAAGVLRRAWLRPSLAGLLLAAALAAALTATPQPAAAQASGYGDAEIQDARDRVLGDSRYQTERPETEKLPDIEPWTLPPWLAEALFWVLVAAVVAMVLFFLYSLLSDLLQNRDAFRRNREGKPAGPARIETPTIERRTVDRRSLAEADRLAAEGRFTEAIHLLLLVAMDRLHRELGPRVAPAMTGREVLRLPALPEATVAPLTRMVQVSEINHFGGRAAAAPDYQSCRDEFLRFNGAAPVAA
ncbi:MAG: hypothetical protein RLN99_03615 [Kiloniellaceae bacterium]